MILIVCGLGLTALAGVLVWGAATRWWHYLVIAVAWVPLFPLVAQHLTGDVSRYLPDSAFSAGIAGKDEIVLASVYSTIVLAIILAAAGFWAIRRSWQVLARR
jgi:hypothetical protein